MKNENSPLSSEVAFKFLKEATESKDCCDKLEKSQSHQELISLAADMGYEVDRISLSQGMKVLADNAMKSQGIPSWVIARSSVMVHD